jgi:hypothetical protein
MPISTGSELSENHLRERVGPKNFLESTHPLTQGALTGERFGRRTRYAGGEYFS